MLKLTTQQVMSCIIWKNREYIDVDSMTLKLNKILEENQREEAYPGQSFFQRNNPNIRRAEEKALAIPEPQDCRPENPCRLCLSEKHS